MLLGWWIAAALGQSALHARASLHEAMALEGIHGDLEGAARHYLRMSRNPVIDDATRGESLLSLGQALYDLGRPALAREALLEGIRSGVCPTRCRDLLETMEIDLESISVLPVTWTFDESDHGFFHSATVQDLGSIKLDTAPDGDRALAWSTSAQPRRPDRLLLGLIRPSPPPTALSIRITSEHLDAVLQNEAEDEAGNRYRLAEARALPRGRSRALDLPVSLLLPTQPGSPPLDPRQLTRLVLVDLTGARTSGDNLLWIHSFALR